MKKIKFYQRHEAFHKPIWYFFVAAILLLLVWGIAGCATPKSGCPSTQKLSGYK